MKKTALALVGVVLLAFGGTAAATERKLPLRDARKLARQLADRELQKRDPTLTGFSVGRVTVLPLKVGQKDTFPLTDDASAEVTLLHPEGKEQKPRLSIKPPQMGEFVIETCCGKFFPIFTRCRSEKQEQVIMAVMVKPCPKKEKP